MSTLMRFRWVIVFVLVLALCVAAANIIDTRRDRLFALAERLESTHA